MKTILITGGAGFIGSHVVDAFVKNNYQVVVVDNYSSKNSGYKNPLAEYIEIDITSTKLEDVFKTYNVDFCVHLAAQASVAVANIDPIYDANINILGTINLLNLCKKYNIKKIIAASSAAVYGTPKQLPLNESQSVSPISYYGLSKLTMEKYIELSGLDYLIFRFSNVYGERQTAEGEAGVVAIFANAMEKNLPINIYGDGEQTRDFIYVKDVARACLNSIESDLTGEIINVSTNSKISVNELFNIMANLYSYTQKPNYKEERLGDIKDSRLENSKLMELLKIEQMYEFKDGINKMYNSVFCEM